MLYNFLDFNLNDDVNEYMLFYEFVNKQYKTRIAKRANLLDDFSIKLNYNIKVIGGMRVVYKKQFFCEFYIINQNNIYNSNDLVPHADTQFNFYNLYGRILLNSFWSRTVIRPERLGDKFVELFNKREIDFESHQIFSDKYYVLSDNEEEFRNKISFDFLEYLETMDDLTLELNEKECVFYLPKTNDFKESLRLLEIGYQLNLLLNKLN